MHEEWNCKHIPKKAHKLANLVSALPLKSSSGQTKCRLNHLQIALPRGLYGVVVDWQIPYILQRWEMISLSKDHPWSLWIQAGMPKMLNHFSTSNLSTIIAFWLDVTKAWLNFEKASVRTRMFSFPPFEGSALVKFIQSNSRGWLAVKVHCWVLGSI